jgi:hypothetical protein
MVAFLRSRQHHRYPAVLKHVPHLWGGFPQTAEQAIEPFPFKLSFLRKKCFCQYAITETLFSAWIVAGYAVRIDLCFFNLLSF